MPPRYAYWTILVDDQPTAFRSGSHEDLMPTFKRIQERHASAKMMWWQNGKLWASRVDAQEAMLARGEIGRSRDVRQRPSLSERRPTASAGRRESKGDRYSDRAPRASERRAERAGSGKLDWKPKGEAAPASRKERSAKPEWKPKGSFRPERSAKLHWKPQPRDDRPSRPEWKPKTSSPPAFAKAPAGKQDLKPSGSEKRKWVPKAEYKKSLGIEAKKDKNWRPGGEHKDPRQKYKDAKKAKWGRFKQTVRKHWESKQGKKEK